MKKKSTDSPRSAEKKPRQQKQKAAKQSEKALLKEELGNDEEFPGYPHYPSQEDIMNPANDVVKAEMDVEEIAQSGKLPKPKPEEAKSEKVKKTESDLPVESPVPIDLKDEDKEVASVSEADVTEEDLLILPSDELNADGGDDEVLKTRIYPVDASAEDLDIPGTELDDENEE